MSNELFRESAPDFSDPLGLLRACHSHIEQHCATLQRLVAHLQEKGVDSEARIAMGKVHHYFSTAGQHHHQDEEQDLFPLLSRQSLKLADKVHRLRQEHVQMDALWQQLGPLLAKPSQLTDIEAFAALVEEFVSAYHHHIVQENEDLLAMAQHILGKDELKKIGLRMAERRGIRLNAL